MAHKKIKVALVQDAPIFFDKEQTLQKIEQIAHDQAEVDLLVFPESFVPGYPRGFSFGTKVGSRATEGRDLYAAYYHNSLDLSGDGSRLEKLAAETKTFLVIGATERKETNGSLYCSMVYVSPTNGFIGVHRKIKPTGQERVIWAEAGAESLVTFDTAMGRLGGLICWENYMPLARQSIYDKGVQIYIAPTADSRPSWSATLQHIALEGRCFVLGCNQFVTKSMYPEKYKSLIEEEPEELCPGGSAIVSPLGEFIEGPIFGKSEVLKATLDLEAITKSKLDFDPNGHYTRPDLFEFKVPGQPEIKKES